MVEGFESPNDTRGDFLGLFAACRPSDCLPGCGSWGLPLEPGPEKWGILAWKPGFYPWAPRQHWAPFPLAHHLCEGPKGFVAMQGGQWPKEGTVAVQSLAAEVVSQVVECHFSSGEGA